MSNEKNELVNRNPNRGTRDTFTYSGIINNKLVMYSQPTLTGALPKLLEKLPEDIRLAASLMLQKIVGSRAVKEMIKIRLAQNFIDRCYENQALIYELGKHENILQPIVARNVTLSFLSYMINIFSSVVLSQYVPVLGFLLALSTRVDAAPVVHEGFPEGKLNLCALKTFICKQGYLTDEQGNFLSQFCIDVEKVSGNDNNIDPTKWLMDCMNLEKIGNIVGNFFSTSTAAINSTLATELYQAQAPQYEGVSVNIAAYLPIGSGGNFTQSMTPTYVECQNHAYDIDMIIRYSMGGGTLALCLAVALGIYCYKQQLRENNRPSFNCFNLNIV
jgi:hypothetical protein